MVQDQRRKEHQYFTYRKPKHGSTYPAEMFAYIFKTPFANTQESNRAI